MKAFAVLLLFLLTAAAGVRADEFDQLKRQLQEQSPKIFKLKRAQLVSEGEKGLLVGSERLDISQRELVQRENHLREQMFAVIARRTGGTPEIVAAQFAARVGKFAPTPATPPAKSPGARAVPIPTRPAPDSPIAMQPPESEPTPTVPQPLAPTDLPAPAFTQPVQPAARTPEKNSPEKDAAPMLARVGDKPLYLGLPNRPKRKRTVFETTQHYGRERGAPGVGTLVMKGIARFGKDAGHFRTVPKDLPMHATLDRDFNCKELRAGDVFCATLESSGSNPKDPDEAEGNFGASGQVLDFPPDTYVEFKVAQVIPADSARGLPTSVFFRSAYLVMPKTATYEEAIPIVASLLKSEHYKEDGKTDPDLVDKYARGAARLGQAFTGSLDVNFNAEAWGSFLGAIMEDKAQQRADVMTGRLKAGTPCYIRTNQEATF